MAKKRSKRSLYEELATAKLARDLAEHKYRELCAIARERFDYGVHKEGDVQVAIQQNRTWNKKRALEAYGDAICTMQVDQKAARQVMTGDEYESFYDLGDPKVVVTVE